MLVEPRVRPGEHALRRLAVHDFTVHEHLEHGSAERLGQSGHVMEGQVHERAVGAKTTVGYKEV